MKRNNNKKSVKRQVNAGAGSARGTNAVLRAMPAAGHAHRSPRPRLLAMGPHKSKNGRKDTQMTRKDHEGSEYNSDWRRCHGGGGGAHRADGRGEGCTRIARPALGRGLAPRSRSFERAHLFYLLLLLSSFLLFFFFFLEMFNK